MSHPLARAAVFALGFLLTGCRVSREMQEQFVDLKNETRYQLTLMDTQSKFLEQKMDLVSEKMDRLETSQSELTRNISHFARRPEEVKHEILEEVDTRSGTISMNQKAFSKEFDGKLEDTYVSMNRALDDELDRMRTTLLGEDEFFRFAFGFQDSMNVVFAQRFDQKPWYTSILGRWEAQQEPQPVP